MRGNRPECGRSAASPSRVEREYATIEEVADVLARLHKLAVPASLGLPQLEPFADADGQIAGSNWLSPEDRACMIGKLGVLRDEYDRLEFNLLYADRCGWHTCENMKFSHAYTGMTLCDGLTTQFSLIYASSSR